MVFSSTIWLLYFVRHIKIPQHNTENSLLNLLQIWYFRSVVPEEERTATLDPLLWSTCLLLLFSKKEATVPTMTETANRQVLHDFFFTLMFFLSNEFWDFDTQSTILKPIKLHLWYKKEYMGFGRRKICTNLNCDHLLFISQQGNYTTPVFYSSVSFSVKGEW